MICFCGPSGRDAPTTPIALRIVMPSAAGPTGSSQRLLACDPVRKRGVFNPEVAYCFATVTPGAPVPQKTKAWAGDSLTCVNAALKSLVVVSNSSSLTISTPYFGASDVMAACPPTAYALLVSWATAILVRCCDCMYWR